MSMSMMRIANILQLQEKKFPFLFILSIMLVSATILLLTSDTNVDFFPYLSLSHLRGRSSSQPYLLPLLSASPPISSPSPLPLSPIVLTPEEDNNVFLANDQTIIAQIQNDLRPLPSTQAAVTAQDNVSLANETSIAQIQNENIDMVETSVTQFRNDDNIAMDELREGWNMSLNVEWKRCASPDYIPCLDNMKAIKKLKSKKHMEHRERHCPKPSPCCLVPLPQRYKVPLPWPKSRDMIWYDNVPHPKLVEYKKDQNWIRKSGPFFVFPGGGTQFKDGVIHYINFIQKSLPAIEWGKNVRVVLDVGCGVASFGGLLLEKYVITMSFAPKDEHEAQIQFALERGIPATLAVIGTQKLPFPSNVYDVIHCARCRVHWHGYGGKPLLELNRILRPGGFFIWSATPVYKLDEGHHIVWQRMESLTKSMCWKIVAKTRYTKVGVVIYQKPDSDSCYENGKNNDLPVCQEQEAENTSWYTPLLSCIPRLPVDQTGKLLEWPLTWPRRLTSRPVSLSAEPRNVAIFIEDTRHWSELVSGVYLDGLAINWTRVRNVMDMNAGYGGFAAALIDKSLWVMNVIPIEAQDTLSIIFDRGLIGMYHDWCESFNTYPRSYDLLHSSFLFANLSQR